MTSPPSVIPAKAGIQRVRSARIRRHYTKLVLRKNVEPGVYYVIIVSYRPEVGDYVLHTEAVIEPGDSPETAKRLKLGSPAAGTIGTEDDVDYFRLDFTESTHVIIDVTNVNHVALDGRLLDASSTEIGENIYSLHSRFTHVHGNGFQIRDHFSPGTYYLKVALDGRPEPRPVPYMVFAVEDTALAEFSDDCADETQALNDPSISDPLYACQWHLNSPDYVDINVEPARDDGVLGEGCEYCCSRPRDGCWA